MKRASPVSSAGSSLRVRRWPMTVTHAAGGLGGAHDQLLASAAASTALTMLW